MLDVFILYSYGTYIVFIITIIIYKIKKIVDYSAFINPSIQFADLWIIFFEVSKNHKICYLNDIHG